MISEIETGFETKLKTITAVANSVFTDAAKYNVADPYLLVTYPSGSNDYDSMKTYPQNIIQVAGYSRTKATLLTLEANVLTKMDLRQTSYSLTSYNIVNILCQFKTQSELDGVYFFIHQYKVDIEPK